MNAVARQAAKPLGWLGIVRLGLVQAGLGAIVVMVTSTLNRVMVVEYRLPAMLPGVLVALHYGVQLLRPRFGFGSDQGGRRTPWIIAGLCVLAAGGVLCIAATVLIPSHFLLGLALAVCAYAAVGMGVGAAGTSLLVLLASLVAPERRAAAASIMWIMMIAGFAITSTLTGRFLDPFSPARLLQVTSMAIAIALAISLAAVAGTETARAATSGKPARGAHAHRGDFRAALRRVWSEAAARRFTWFVFIAMLAYSAEELLLEPYAGLVFGYSIGASAQLSGLWHASALCGMIGVGIANSWAARFCSLRTWIIGGCVASAVALLTLSFASFNISHWPLRACVVGLGIANGAFAVAAIGSMMELSQQGETGAAGIRMGLWGAAQAIAFAMGGLAANSLLDVVRHFAGSAMSAYAAVFALEAVLFGVAAVIAARLSFATRAPMLHARVTVSA